MKPEIVFATESYGPPESCGGDFIQIKRAKKAIDTLGKFTCHIEFPLERGVCPPEDIYKLSPPTGYTDEMADRLVERYGVDVPFFVRGNYLAFSLMRHGVRVVSFFVDTGNPPLDERVYRGADYIAWLHPQLEQRARGMYGPRNDGFVFHVCADDHTFRPDHRNQELIDWKDGCVLVGYGGGSHRWKGIEDLIVGVARCPSVKLVLAIGKWLNSERKDTITTYLSSLLCPDRYRLFAGLEQSDLAGVLASCDIFYKCAPPSIDRHPGIGLLDYMCLARPVLTREGTWSAGVVARGHPVVSGGDVALGIRSLVDLGSEGRGVLGEENRQILFSRGWTLGGTAKTTENYIYSVLGGVELPDTATTDVEVS